MRKLLGFILYPATLNSLLHVTLILLLVVRVFEPRHDKKCLREFPTRSGTKRPAQPQKLATVLKCRL